VTKPTILVVDDEPMMTSIVSEVGELGGFDVIETNSASEFQSAWQDHDPTVVVMDVIMPDMDGVELLKWLSEQKCLTPIILMSGYDKNYMEMASTVGTRKGNTIVGTLTKPFQIAELEALLQNTLLAYQ
jgi:CheY-like chemotaxis protein